MKHQKWSEYVVLLTFWLGNVLRATTACTFSTSQLPKVVRTCRALYILTWKFASRHNSAHFFDISTFQKWWRALYILTWKFASHHKSTHFFDISTPKSGLIPSVFNTFDLETCFAPQRKVLRACNAFSFLLPNVLRATTACNFSSLIWPAGSTPAALARLLFDPPEPQIIGKTQWIVTFLPFRAPAASGFSLFLFSDLLTSWLLLPDSSHLCFFISP